MQHPDEGMIHTWLDGELSAEDAAALEAHVAGCPQCAAAVAEARGLVAGSSRIVSALDSVPAGVIPAAAPGNRAWYSTTQFRAAAALLLVAGTSLLVVRKNETKGDSIMAVATPRAVATDAISPEASVPALSQKAAVTKPATPPATSRESSNSAVAAAASPATVTKKGRMEPAAAHSPLSGLAASPQMAVQDSASAGAVAIESVAEGITLRLIRTDSLRSSTKRVFEMPNGTQLIMTESSELGFRSSAAQSLSAKTLSVSPRASAVQNAPAVPAASAKDEVKLSGYRTITWVDAATGRSYSLTGPLPPDQLEKFKPLVIKLSR